MTLQAAAQGLVDRIADLGASPLDWSEYTALEKALEAAQAVEPVAWTLTETLDKRVTTTSGYLWFSDPVNCCWTPLYLHQAPPQAQSVEPVGEIVIFGEDLKEVSWAKGKMPSVGSKLYAHPAGEQAQAVELASLSWANLALWYEAGAADWSALKGIVTGMLRAHTAPPPTATGERAELIEKLRWAGAVGGNETCTQAADMLEADERELELLGSACDKIRINTRNEIHLYLSRIIELTEAQQVAVTMTDEEAKNLLKNSDLLEMFEHIGWYSAPRKSFIEHSMSLIRAIEAHHGIGVMP